jgi:hypothetical protein
MRDEHAHALGYPTSPPPVRPGPDRWNGDATAGRLRHEGLDLTLEWEGVVRFTLAGIRDGREGIRGELTVWHADRRLVWGAWTLASLQIREAFTKKLRSLVSGPPWDVLLEEAAYAFTQAAREGEPLVTLTGKATAPPVALVPRLLYAGEPTLLYADGDTGKSLFALALAVAVASGTSLPAGLTPGHAVPVLYLDWETSAATVERRQSLLAAGLGIPAPPVLYRRMTQPLVDVAGALAADCARRAVGLVVVDSQVFALAMGDGAAFHEPTTRFYAALRLFAPAAALVLNHVTNADARTGTAPRPFGGAFAFNAPRLVWEAKRDKDVEDATALAFACRKANNFARRPDPFGLRFEEGPDRITVRTWDLREATPSTTASASIPYRIRLALGAGALTVAALAERLDHQEDTVRRTVQRLRERGTVISITGSKPTLWALASR